MQQQEKLTEKERERSAHQKIASDVLAYEEEQRRNQQQRYEKSKANQSEVRKQMARSNVLKTVGSAVLVAPAPK